MIMAHSQVRVRRVRADHIERAVCLRALMVVTTKTKSFVSCKGRFIAMTM